MFRALPEAGDAREALHQRLRTGCERASPKVQPSQMLRMLSYFLAWATAIERDVCMCKYMRIIFFRNKDAFF